MKKLGIILMVFITAIGLVLFNAFYLQKLYELGVMPVMALFNTELPFISYGAFIVIAFLSSAIITAYKTPNVESKDTFTYGTYEFEEGLTHVIGQLISNVVGKLLNLLTLWILVSILIA